MVAISIDYQRGFYNQAVTLGEVVLLTCSGSFSTSLHRYHSLFPTCDPSNGNCFQSQPSPREETFLHLHGLLDKEVCNVCHDEAETDW